MRKHIIFLFVVAQFIAPLIFIGCSGCRDDTKISADIGHDHTLKFILIHEGGVTPDGLTYAGITQHTWESMARKADRQSTPTQTGETPCRKSQTQRVGRPQSEYHGRQAVLLRLFPRVARVGYPPSLTAHLCRFCGAERQ